MKMKRGRGASIAIIAALVVVFVVVPVVVYFAVGKKAQRVGAELKLERTIGSGGKLSAMASVPESLVRKLGSEWRYKLVLKPEDKNTDGFATTTILTVADVETGKSVNYVSVSTGLTKEQIQSLSVAQLWVMSPDDTLTKLDLKSVPI
jgi:hypothetical protein